MCQNGLCQFTQASASSIWDPSNSGWVGRKRLTRGVSNGGRSEAERDETNGEAKEGGVGGGFTLLSLPSLIYSVRKGSVEGEKPEKGGLEERERRAISWTAF